METSNAARRQFGLADLLAYLLAGSVYLAMIVSLQPLIEGRAVHSARDVPSWWPGWISTAIAWSVLLFLYRRWRLPQALLVLCVGPMAALAMTAMALLVGLFVWFDNVAEFQRKFAAIILTDCSLSVAISLPVATLLLAYRGLRPK